MPASFDGDLDEGIRGLESALSVVPGDRYPLAANETAWQPLENLRTTFYKLENWLYANWHSALRKKPRWRK